MCFESVGLLGRLLRSSFFVLPGVIPLLLERMAEHREDRLFVLIVCLIDCLFVCCLFVFVLSAWLLACFIDCLCVSIFCLFVCYLFPCCFCVCLFVFVFVIVSFCAC